MALVMQGMAATERDEVISRRLRIRKSIYIRAQQHSRYFHSTDFTKETNKLWIEHLDDSKATAENREAALDYIVNEKKRKSRIAADCLKMIDPGLPPRMVEAKKGPVFLYLSSIYVKAGGKASIPSNLKEVRDKFCDLVKEEQENKSKGPAASRLAALAYQRHVEFMEWIEAETRICEMRREVRTLQEAPRVETPAVEVGGKSYEEFTEGEEGRTEQVLYAPPPTKSKEELEMETKRKQGFKSFYDGWDIEGEHKDQGGEES